MHSKQKNTDFIQFLLQVGWAYATTIRKAYNVLCRLLRESSAAHFLFCSQYMHAFEWLCDGLVLHKIKKQREKEFHRKANCQKTVKKEQFNPFQVSSTTKFICSPLCVIRNAATFQLSMAQLIWSSARVLISKRTWLSMAIECRFRLKESSFIPWKKKQVFGWASERSNALLHRNHLSFDTRAYSNEKLDPSGKWQREFYSRITLWSTPKKPFISNQISKDSMVTSLDSHVKWN